MANYAFRGIMTPVLTPFKKDLTLNLEVIPKFAKYLLHSGIKAVLVSGTTGEGMALSVSERKQLIDAWKDATLTTKQHMMVQVGGAPLPDVLDLSAYSEKAGVDSLLCLPELYYKPTTPQRLIDYMKIIGESAPRTPLFYYNFPVMSAVNVNVADFLNQAVGQIPTLAGCKFTSNDLHTAYEALKSANSSYTVFLGSNTLISAGFALGFDSAIPAATNLVPKLSLDIVNAIQEHRVDEAKKLQDKQSTIVKILSKNGVFLPGLKAAVNMFSPVDFGTTRAPVKVLSTQETKEIETALKEYL